MFYTPNIYLYDPCLIISVKISILTSSLTSIEIGNSQVLNSENIGILTVHQKSVSKPFATTFPVPTTTKVMPSTSFCKTLHT